MRHIVVGTRSNLGALAAARKLVATLKEEWPETNFKLQGIATEPARLETALQSKKIDIAVQQMEFLPLHQQDGLELGAITRRVEPRLAFLGRNQHRTLASLPAGSSVGTGIGQCLTQLASLRPDLKLVALDGDSEDQMEAFSTSGLDALLMPTSTLLHLDLRSRISELVASEILLPSPGQGGLGLLVRDDDDAARELAYSLQHHPSDDRITAERAALEGLGLEIGNHNFCALANINEDNQLGLDACFMHENKILRAHSNGESSQAEEIGFELAEKLQALKK